MELTIDCEGTELQIGRKALTWPLHRILRLLRFFSVFFFVQYNNKFRSKSVNQVLSYQKEKEIGRVWYSFPTRY